MIPPVLAGALTAVAYAVSTLASARASRLADPSAAVAGVMVVGTLVLLPIVLFVTPIPATASPGTVGPALVWSTVAGAANVGGLLLAYAAYRIGAVGVVSTIGSTEGAIAALISVLAGQQLAPGAGFALGAVAIGVVLAATGGGHELEEGVAISRATSLRAAGLAGCAALLLGSGLFIAGHASTALPAAWVVLPGRVAGVALVTVPLFVFRRPSVSRRALRFIVVTGLAEVVGLVSFSIGARQDIAVTSVLGSMFPPIAAVAAFVLFRERLARRQILGIGVVVAGIGALGALSST
ncbi:MAG TPA: EamA family transporter [Candidatus Limnocylindrales bacterium]|nr:EamA family transporter [Candidatus Limnocylindrales bacterium]